MPSPWSRSPGSASNDPRTVHYWAVAAVFVCDYEVIARYAYNSPTNWVHESMYLMFGMQYLITDSYAMLTESHMGVDVLYAPLSPRRKAVVDLFTSIFFIFAGTLLLTSWIYAMDAIAVLTGNVGSRTGRRGAPPRPRRWGGCGPTASTPRSASARSASTNGRSSSGP